jgi:signal transduction histidine kinase
MDADVLCSSPAGAQVPKRVAASVTAAVVAVAAVLVGGTVLAEAVSGLTGRLLGLDGVVGVVGCALLPVALRWPVGGGLALAALATLSPAATPPAMAGALVVARVRRLPVALVVGAAGVAAQAVQGLWRPVGGLSYPWWLALVTASYAALLGWGTLTQARVALVESLRQRAYRAEAEQGWRVAEARVLERARIGREMHDVLAHRLSLLTTYAGALEYRPDAPPEQLSQAAGVVRAGLHQALDELREVVSMLRKEDPADADGTERELTLAAIPGLVQECRDAGQQVTLDDRTPSAVREPGMVGRTAYRVVQEGLTNARKHAAGQPVRVVVDGEPGGALVIDIHNGLSGAATGTPGLPGGGLGLAGLSERLRLVCGALEHGVTASGEFQLHASLPWRG